MLQTAVTHTASTAEMLPREESCDWCCSHFKHNSKPFAYVHNTAHAPQMVQVAQRSTVQRFIELQNSNASLEKELSQAKQQLTKIAEEKEAAAAFEKKRTADRLQRRPERNKAFKVVCTSVCVSSRCCTSILQIVIKAKIVLWNCKKSLSTLWLLDTHQTRLRHAVQACCASHPGCKQLLCPTLKASQYLVWLLQSSLFQYCRRVLAYSSDSSQALFHC